MPEDNTETIARLKIIRDVLYTGLNPLVHFDDARHMQMEQAYKKTQSVIEIALKEISTIISTK